MTLTRAIVGLLASLVIGIIWGFLAGKYRRFALLMLPLQQLLVSTPPIIFVILTMVWFGTTGNIVIIVVALIATPIVSTAATQAVKQLDHDLTEMMQIFRFTARQRFSHFLLPSLAPPIFAAVTVALGMSIRVSVMAELIATASGLGGELRLAQINIQTPEVFAYAVVLTTLTFVLELLFVQPIRSRLESHREQTTPI